MLRLFLTVSVLFWQQLAAHDKVDIFCRENHCVEPAEVIQHKNYEEKKFLHPRWLETMVHGMDINRAIETGLERLFNYSHFSNAAGTIVPISAPWGVIGQLASGKIEQTFRVYVSIVPEVISPPEPTDQTVKIVREPPSSYYLRTFDRKVDEKQYEELVKKFLRDLEQDNRHVYPRFFIALYNTHGLMQIGCRKKQLAAQDELQEVIDFCNESDCIEPAEVIQHTNYEEEEFLHFQWIGTMVHGMDLNSAIETSLDRLFNYSHFSNAAAGPLMTSSKAVAVQILSITPPPDTTFVSLR
ncbi:uncharacterized protein LOC144680419 [Cetorhinus maximus]